VNPALLVSALLMGLAGTPHCLAMCGAACTAITGGGRGLWPFHLARALSYAVAGALAAASVGVLATMGEAVGALRPLWVLVHIAALALGMYLVWQGRQPAWMANLGTTRAAAVPGGWQAMRGPTRRVALGLAWAAWPCGLLQSALLVAALASSPWQGAAVMATFAAASGAGLVLGPALWWRLGRGREGAAASAAAVRLAGLMLVLASAWSLGHGLWMRVAAWCGLA
jgi:sulfite exporter TauE/SafE